MFLSAWLGGFGTRWNGDIRYNARFIRMMAGWVESVNFVLYIVSSIHRFNPMASVTPVLSVITSGSSESAVPSVPSVASVPPTSSVITVEIGRIGYIGHARYIGYYIGYTRNFRYITGSFHWTH